MVFVDLSITERILIMLGSLDMKKTSQLHYMKWLPGFSTSQFEFYRDLYDEL